MAPEVIASIVAAFTALAAVILGPFITFRAQMNQMLGPMRQAWINNLREVIAEFIAQVYVSRWNNVASDAELEEIQRASKAEDKARIERAFLLKEKVALMINPKEVEHQELLRLIESAYDAYHNGKPVSKLAAAIRSQAQIVLKAEWNVVKG